MGREGFNDDIITDTGIFINYSLLNMAIFADSQRISKYFESLALFSKTSSSTPIKIESLIVVPTSIILRTDNGMFDTVRFNHAAVRNHVFNLGIFNFRRGHGLV